MSSDPHLGEAATLISRIEEIRRITNDEWLATLDERKKAELAFHNRDRDRTFVRAASQASDTYEKFYGNKKYYRATDRSKRYIQGWIARQSRGRIFLDYACGNGLMAILSARSGATLACGLDISDVSISNATEEARRLGLDNTAFFQADAENTKLPDASIDAILCSGMLHHLDLDHALPELRRILKPGGKILCAEALDYNPLIKLYRRLTPAMRTEWERSHILSLRDVERAERFFQVNDIRYWHIVGYLGGKFPSLLPLLDRMDRGLEAVPFINRLAWMFTFELEKRPD